MVALKFVFPKSVRIVHEIYSLLGIYEYTTPTKAEEFLACTQSNVYYQTGAWPEKQVLDIIDILPPYPVGNRLYTLSILDKFAPFSRLSDLEKDKDPCILKKLSSV